MMCTTVRPAWACSKRPLTIDGFRHSTTLFKSERLARRCTRGPSTTRPCNDICKCNAKPAGSCMVISAELHRVVIWTITIIASYPQPMYLSPRCFQRYSSVLSSGTVMHARFFCSPRCSLRRLVKMMCVCKGMRRTYST
jgi:hypothetical protein